jgi:hypothetical protein
VTGHLLPVRSKSRCRVLVSALALLGAAFPAAAGIPFVTDDPDTPDAGHFEINFASQYTHRQGDASGNIASAEVNYGVLERLAFRVTAPLAFDHTPDAGTSRGIGDVEFGVKYRIVDQDDSSWLPSLAFAPAIAAPTGDVKRGLGTGRTHTFLPIWISKEFEQWTVSAGGGYDINPGQDNRNWWLTSVGVTREVSPALTLGAELFHNSAMAVGGKSSTGFNVGAVYNLSDSHHLFLSVGRNIRNVAVNNQFSSLVGWQITF